MILQSQDQGFQFLCKQCHQYINRARVCSYCETMFCYNMFLLMDITVKAIYNVSQYLANQLNIKCRLCNQIQSIHKIKTHEAKCHQKEQQALNYFQVRQKILVTQTSKQNYQRCSAHKSSKHIICLKCLQVQFYPDQQKYQIQMSEEQLCTLRTQQFQCPNCMKKGNYFKILNHNYICKQQFIDCQCGWLGRRTEFQDHFKICANNQLEKLHTQLTYVNQVKQIIKFHLENTKEEFYDQSFKICNNYDIVNGFISYASTRSITYDYD